MHRELAEKAGSYWSIIFFFRLRTEIVEVLSLFIFIQCRRNRFGSCQACQLPSEPIVLSFAIKIHQNLVFLLTEKRSKYLSFQT